jgi:hypothetical protein
LVIKGFALATRHKQKNPAQFTVTGFFVVSKVNHNKVRQHTGQGQVNKAKYCNEYFE